MRARKLLAAIAATAGIVTVAVAPAGAVELTCGQTITQNTTLTADVLNCPQAAIVIGAPGITLDLGGRTVSGGAGNRAHGILNTGHANVTVKNGTVSGFGLYGVRLAGVAGNVVEGMQLVGNATGIGMVDSTDSVFRNSTVRQSGFVGVNLTGGDRNLVEGNTIRTSAGQAVFVQHSVSESGGAHVVRNNTVRGNGIWVSLGPTGAQITGNDVRGSARDGISVFDASTVVTGNRTIGNRGHGINAPSGAVNGGGNVARLNGLAPQCRGLACRRF